MERNKKNSKEINDKHLKEASISPTLGTQLVVCDLTWDSIQSYFSLSRSP